jgi:hypothetical protein
VDSRVQRTVVTAEKEEIVAVVAVEIVAEAVQVVIAVVVVAQAVAMQVAVDADNYINRIL